MRLIVAILAGVLWPSWSGAQPALPDNDATVTVGWAGSEYRLDDYDRWRGSLLLGVSGGHYWTDHAKTDIEVGWNSAANSETYQDLVVGGVRTSTRATYRARDLRVSIAQVYQFGRNEWIHPYIGVGADLVRRKVTFDRPAQTGYPIQFSSQARPPNTVIPAERRIETDVFARPFAKTGLKMYASERLFFVTELKLGFAPDLDHVVWKLGLGFDF
jgi:hypothetical protein